MGAFLKLPENYRESFRIDLQKDKKLSILVNTLAVLIYVIVVVAGFLIAPVEQLLYGRLWVLYLAGSALYIVIHELIHGIFMRAFSGIRPQYGFTGLYAYAGSKAYFDRPHYIVITLAPVVIWGVVLAILCVLTWKTSWFWLAYLLEGLNLSSAAGDLYVTWRFLSLPKDILIQDPGVSMTVYTKRI